MSQYKFSLKERHEVAEGTVAFIWDTSVTPDFNFRAGQFVTLTLENPLYTDEKGNSRDFSIASSPNDRGIIMIASRMTGSAFKRSLLELPFGAEIMADGPFGMFSLHEKTDKKAVFIAGGIGITLSRSIIKYATEEKLPHKITLLYSNRNPRGAAFLRDLNNWEHKNPNLKVIATMTQVAPEDNWRGETGYIDENFIKNKIEDLSSSIFYIVGPPGMVKGVTESLEKVGISRDEMRFEEFTGY
ncbi:FAD-dependent oxidoreductase [Candidatus Giovannonibacteria bacterium]|nr:FAD-dependent oxidoreductase [Candidatus Giovannonibacteria bacterium]